MNLQLLVMSERNGNGTFKRTHNTFSLDNFEDGYIDVDGRFRVYLPNNPRSNAGGYAYRSIVAYELYHGIQVPETMAIHHIDGNRVNDSKENLVMLLFSQHSSLHNKPRTEESLVPRQCKHCGKTFFINRYRLNEGIKEGRLRGQFCTLKCYYKHPHSEIHNQNIAKGLKRFRDEGRI